MTPLTPPTVDTLSLPVAVAVEPSGRFAYAITNANGVFEYTIGANGALTIVGSPPASAVVLDGIAIDPSGRFAYVTDDHTVNEEYSTDGADGHLTALSPATVAAGNAPQLLGVDPSGRYVYAVDQAACAISQYALGSSGALGALAPATVAAGNCPANDFVAFVAVDPSGRFAYVPDQGAASDAVLQYRIGAGGALSPLSPAMTSATTGAAFLRITFLVRYQ